MSHFAADILLPRLIYLELDS